MGQPTTKNAGRGGGVRPVRYLFSGILRAHVSMPQIDDEKYRNRKWVDVFGNNMLSYAFHV